MRSSGYPPTVTPDASVAHTERREAVKTEILTEFRKAALRVVLRAAEHEIPSFAHGPVFAQLHAELNDLEAQMIPNGLKAARKNRKKISRQKRLSVYRRDDFTCQECGWRGDYKDAERPRDRSREARFLTVDHVLPEAEGGSSHVANLRTLCSVCNADKGREVDLAAIRQALLRAGLVT